MRLRTPFAAMTLTAVVLVGGAGFGQAADSWHVGRMGNLTIFACSPPACPSEATVAVTDPLARALPVGRSILDDAALAARMAEGMAVGIGPEGVIMPFRRADLGPHVGLLGVVKADRGSPIAAFISFNENRSRDFLATAGSVREAIDALVAVAEKVPQP
jgi:hypothetical protein